MKTKSFIYIFLIFFLLLFLLSSSSSLFAETNKSQGKKPLKKSSSAHKNLKNKTKKQNLSKNSKNYSKPLKTSNSSKSTKSSSLENSPVKTKYYTVKKGDTLAKIAKKFNLTVEELKGLNNLKSNKLSIGQKLLIYAQKPGEREVENTPSKKETTSFKEREYDYILHRVSPKETLYRISKKYQVPVEEIKKLNGISEKKLQVGMELKIPIKYSQVDTQIKDQITEHPYTKPSKREHETLFLTYTVKKGDNLKEIAGKYNLSVKELKKLNHLRSNKLKPGQKLIVKILSYPEPRATTSSYKEVFPYHIVKEGETLYRISLMYNVPLEELKRVNNLEGNIISVGQKLKIPSSSQIPEKPFVLESPKRTLETKEENLKEKFEKNVVAKNKILTPSMLSKEGEMALRQKFIELSKNLADARYKLGGEGNGYLDCSAFVKLIYEEFGIKLPRSSAQQFQVGVYVEEDELMPGDLVFFKTNGRTISHVGIYLGDNRFIHISSSRKRLSIDSLNDPYFRKRYVGAKRILNGEVLEYFQEYLNKNSLNQETSKDSPRKREASSQTIPEVIF